MSSFIIFYEASIDVLISYFPDRTNNLSRGGWNPPPNRMSPGAPIPERAVRFSNPNQSSGRRRPPPPLPPPSDHYNINNNSPHSSSANGSVSNGHMGSQNVYIPMTGHPVGYHGSYREHTDQGRSERPSSPNKNISNEIHV